MLKLLPNYRWKNVSRLNLIIAFLAFLLGLLSWLYYSFSEMFLCFQHCIAGDFCSPEKFERLCLVLIWQTTCFLPFLLEQKFSFPVVVWISRSVLCFYVIKPVLTEAWYIIKQLLWEIHHPTCSTHAQNISFMKCSEIRAESGGCLLLYHMLSLVSVKQVLVFMPLPFSTFEMFC